MSTGRTKVTEVVFADVVRLLDAPVLILDGERNVLVMNAAAEAVTGRAAAAAAGMPFAEVLGLDPAAGGGLCDDAATSPAGTETAGWQECLCPFADPNRPAVQVRRQALRLADGSVGSLLVLGSRGPWEQRYQDVLAGSPVLFFEAGRDGRILYGASQLAGALGWEEREIAGKTVFALVDPAQVETLRATWDQVLSGRQVRGRELSLVREGDAPRPFWASFFPVVGSSGEIEGVRGTASDLADQKSLAYALEAAEERFSVLFNESSDPILILSMTGEFLSANPSFERLSGVRSDQLFCGEKGWRDFVAEEHVPLLHESIRRCAESGRDDTVEFRLRSADGQELWFEQSHSNLHDEKGVPKGIMAVARDIDRRKQQELKLLERAEEMQRRHQRAQTLVSNLKRFFTRISALPPEMDEFIHGVCGILFEMYRPLRVAVYTVNDAARVYAAGSDLPEGLEESGSPPQLSAMSGQVMESSLPLYCNTLAETRPYDEDAQVRAMGLKTYLGAPLRDSTGKMRGTLSLVDAETRSFDSLDVELITVAALHIAARLRAEEHEQVRRELEEHLRQAQKMEAVGMLAGGIAHDFNNILSGILGFSSFLLSKTDEGTDLYKNLELIEQSAVRAADLTRQLLAFSRRKHFAKQPVSMNTMVEEVLGILNRSLAKSIVIREDLSADLPSVLGDPGQLNQVIMNLCLNAADAMRARGGTLRVKTAHRLLTARERRLLADAGQGEYVCITISDTGKGMSRDVQDHIFDPFFTTRGNEGGTGLGLSIVYGIVTNHGGDITVESAEGKGSVFKVYFPVYRGQAEKRARPAQLQLRGSETILVVDDETIVRQMVTAVLKEYGYRVLSAVSGHEAVEMLKELKGRVHLVLLDMVMPGMDGEATYHALRAIQEDLPVLLTSGFAEEDRSNRLIEQGAKGMVHKPYKSKELAARIREVLAESVWSEDS